MVVATNALGLEIDISNVRAIIHVDTSRSMRDFGQESGRAGRDRQVSDSVVIVPSGYKNIDRRVAEFVHRQRCCRVILDGYLNSWEDQVGCEADKQACFIYQSSTSEPGEAPSEESNIEKIQAR